MLIRNADSLSKVDSSISSPKNPFAASRSPLDMICMPSLKLNLVCRRHKDISSQIFSSRDLNDSGNWQEYSLYYYLHFWVSYCFFMIVWCKSFPRPNIRIEAIINNVEVIILDKIPWGWWRILDLPGDFLSCIFLAIYFGYAYLLLLLTLRDLDLDLLSILSLDLDLSFT